MRNFLLFGHYRVRFLDRRTGVVDSVVVDTTMYNKPVNEISEMHVSLVADKIGHNDITYMGWNHQA
tara:strand:+ start:659 stop:856 length:198 start_codon:yes stop_codon:yes gene_type:complete